MDSRNILEVNETSKLTQDDVLIVGCGESLQKIKCKNFKAISPGVLKVNGQEYDGSKDINISREVVSMNGSNLTVSLDPNKTYFFEEMAILSYMLGGDNASDSTYMFSFISGETPTVLTHPENITTDLVVKQNTVYVITIKENILAYSEMEI